MTPRRIQLLAAAIAICGAVPAHADPVAGNPDRRILRERPIQENHVGGGKYILPYNFDLVDPMEGKGASTPTWRLPFGASPLTLSRCTLSIAGGPVIDAKGCAYRKAEQGFAVTGPSASGKYAYTVRIAFREDRTATGYVAGGRTGSERALGDLARKGNCWAGEDGAVELCAWR